MTLKRISRPCILAALAVVPATAAAQTAAPATAQPGAPAEPQVDAADNSALGDIIVTAQRRSENQQSVPISVTAVSGSTATLLGVTNPQNLTIVVPGFQFQRNSSGAVPFLRGVGTSGSSIGNEPSVATFLDDVYITSGKAAIFEFNNVSSIEVLKGPQGTLFGRNATGGVINIHTKDPSLTETTLDLDVGIANYATKSAHLFASIPLSNSIAISVAAFGTDQNDGWGRNVITGAKVFTDKAWGVHGKILFKPSDDFSALLAYVHADRKSDQGMAERVVPGYFGYANYSPEALGAGFYDSVANGPNYYRNIFDQVSLRLERNFTNATLRSISAYGEINTKLFIDNDASPTNQFYGQVPNSGHTFTQEVQLLSAKSSSIKWILGAFYMHDISTYEATSIGTSPTGSATVFGGVGNYNRNRWAQNTDSISGYAQVTAEILPKTNLTAGFRYTSDSRREHDASAAVVTNTGAIVTSSPVFGSTTVFKDVSGRLSLDHHFTRDIMIYAAYSRGFKSGVYNVGGYTTASVAPLPAVQPEKLDAYTAGFKSELFGRHLRLNAEAFYYDYSNIQVGGSASPPNVGTILINGGQATIKGVDIDMTFAPTSNLQISGGISILDGKYKVFDKAPTYFPLPPNQPIAIPAGCPAGTTYPADSNNGAAQLLCSAAGNKTAFTPPFTTTLSVIYTIPTSVGKFDLSSNWQHGGNYYGDPDNLSFDKQPKYDLVNASIRWTSGNGSYWLKFWANNILQQKYYSYFAAAGAAGSKYGPAAPRTFGATAGVHF
jgi:iron complex outermembrane receptor protein